MNSPYNSKKFLNKKRKIRKIKRTLFIFFLLGLIGGFFYWMSRPALNIQEIEVTNNTFSKTNQIKKVVLSILSGEKYFLIPKTNILFLSKKEIEKEVKNNFSDIKKINFDLDGFNKIKLEIIEYEPKIIWRQGDKSYFVNEEGVIFLEEPLLHSYDDLLILEGTRNEVKIGDKIIDVEFLKGLDNFIEQLKKMDIIPLKIENPEQDIFRIKTKKGFELVISSRDNLEDSLKNIKTIIEKGAIKEEDLDKVDYVDLRFGNKIFYKLK